MSVSRECSTPLTTRRSSVINYRQTLGVKMNRVVVIDALNMFIRNYIVNGMISTNGNPVGGAVD
jgi:hypothetical protein